MSYGTILSLTWAGQFFNSVLPGSTGGDVVKIYQICQLAPERKAAAASTVFVDRLSALIALLVLGGAAILIDPKPLLLLPRPNFSFSTALSVSALGILAVGAVWVLVRMLRGTQLLGRITRTLTAARDALKLNGNLVAALLLAFGIHLVNFLAIYFFARALSIPITLPQVVLMMPVILLFLLVPVTINGHGLREVLLIAYFGYIGVVVAGYSNVDVRETAIALSLITVANDLLWSVPGGLLYLWHFRTSSVRAQPGRGR